MMASAKIIFDTFWKSGLHGGSWGKTVYSVLVYTEHSPDSPSPERVIHLFKNDTGRHSEHNAVTALTHLLRTHSIPSQTIQWYINYSPCRKCSDTISQFVTDAKLKFNVKIKIDMVASFLYKIRRPSCEEKKCPHLLTVSLADHEKTVEGLEQLRTNGVDVRTFGELDWIHLAIQLRSLLSSPCPRMDERCLEYRTSPRQQEDMLMKNDLQKVTIQSRIESLLLTLGRYLRVS